MTETPAIYSDLVKVMRAVGAVGKNGRNTHQNYDFRGIDGVLDAVGPALREYGVVVIPSQREKEKAEVVTSGGKKSVSVDLVMDYTFYSSSDGSSVTATVSGESMDTGDKATPKANSVAFRTALIQALALPTNEPDPDSFTYTREALDEQHKYIAGQVEQTNSIEELRELYSKADKTTQERIMEKVKRIQEADNAGSNTA